MSEFKTRVFTHSHSQPAVHEDVAAALSAPAPSWLSAAEDRPAGTGRPATVTGTPVGDPSAPSSPFEFFPTGEPYGVCDLDGVCF
jgi:hypothetical protein